MGGTNLEVDNIVEVLTQKEGSICKLGLTVIVYNKFVLFVFRRTLEEQQYSQHRRSTHADCVPNTQSGGKRFDIQHGDQSVRD